MSAVTADQRFLLDPLVEVLRKSYQGTLTRDVHASMLHPFDDPLVAKRNFPMRVIDIELGGNLADHLIFAGCFRDDVINAITQESIDVLLTFIGVEADSVISLTQHEIATVDEAVDMLDGLWSCPTVTYGHPSGDLMVIFGTGLARACEAIVEVNEGRYPGQPQPAGSSADIPEAVKSPAAELADQAEPTASEAQSTSPASPVTAFDGFADFSTQPISPQADLPPSAFTSSMPQVDVMLSAELGSTQMNLGAVASLGANTVLTLDQRMDEPVQVLVNGVPYATARMVVVDGEYGIEILEVLDLGASIGRLAA